ncbi:MAG: hypothetical protein ABSH03_18605 [Candidatus Lustribacter sp.]|jgi:hypothetical protein
MTSIGTVDFGSQIWDSGDDEGFTAALPLASTAQASEAGGDRDAQIADLADTSAGVNQLQSLASATAASTLPVPSLPSVQQQTQAQQAAAQPPLKLDYYADGDDGE